MKAQSQTGSTTVATAVYGYRHLVRVAERYPRWRSDANIGDKDERTQVRWVDERLNSSQAVGNVKNE